MAEQKDADSKVKEDEMRLQYEKEQELYNNRMLMSSTSESKEKLSLGFMYEAPPGVKKDQDKDGEEPEFRFEWQRHAPRESTAKNSMDVRDQPFGIAVRNVRCLKCHKWGHINTDRECPLFAASTSFSELVKPETTKTNAAELLNAMKEDGLALKKSLVGQSFDPSKSNQVMIPVSEDDPEMAFLKSLSKKEKKKLLKKLDKLSGGGPSIGKKSHKKHKKNDSSGDDSDKYRHKKYDRKERKRSRSPKRRRSPSPDRKHRKRHSSTSSDSSSDDRRKRRRHESKERRDKSSSKRSSHEHRPENKDSKKYNRK